MLTTLITVVASEPGFFESTVLTLVSIAAVLVWIFNIWAGRRERR